jgi:hypothetical protein
MRDAGEKLNNPFNAKGDAVSLAAIYFLTSVPFTTQMSGENGSNA